MPTPTSQVPVAQRIEDDRVLGNLGKAFHGAERASGNDLLNLSVPTTTTTSI